MTPYEAACFIARIGFLNIFNPCKPEGFWELNIGRREERVIAKAFVTLAKHEPGENWNNHGFRWSYDMDPTPGWELVSFSFFPPTAFSYIS